MLLTPLKLDDKFDMKINLEGGLAWNRPGTAKRSAESIDFELDNKKISGYCSETTSSNPFVDSYSPYLSVVLNKTLGFATSKVGVETIKQRINQKEAEYKKETLKYKGVCSVLSANSYLRF